MYIYSKIFSECNGTKILGTFLTVAVELRKRALDLVTKCIVACSRFPVMQTVVQQ